MAACEEREHDSLQAAFFEEELLDPSCMGLAFAPDRERFFHAKALKTDQAQKEAGLSKETVIAYFPGEFEGRDAIPLRLVDLAGCPIRLGERARNLGPQRAVLRADLLEDILE